MHILSRFVWLKWHNGENDKVEQSANSLWPNDAIWRQRSGSTLARVMACYWRHQAITWTHVDLSPVKSCGTHRRELLWEDLQIPISKTRLKIPFLELHSDLPGTIELMSILGDGPQCEWMSWSAQSVRAVDHFRDSKSEPSSCSRNKMADVW